MTVGAAATAEPAGSASSIATAAPSSRTVRRGIYFLPFFLALTIVKLRTFAAVV